MDEAEVYNIYNPDYADKFWHGWTDTLEVKICGEKYLALLNLHGFAQTYSPWFNEMGQKWDNYDVEKCLKYNQGLIDDIMAAGWKMNFLRLHMDPYWSNSPGIHVEGENDISAFDFNRFKNYLDRVFIPMAEYAVSKGLYVVMRPPGVCPEKIAVGDEYNQYLIKVWTHVAQHPKLKNHPNFLKSHFTFFTSTPAAPSTNLISFTFTSFMISAFSCNYTK